MPQEDALATSPLSLMQEEPRTTPLRVVAASPSPDKCCKTCEYRPERVAWLLRMIDTLAQSGYHPAEALASILADNSDIRSSPHDSGIKAAVRIVADLSRAMQAGKRDPVSIATYLCPWALIDEPEGQR